MFKILNTNSILPFSINIYPVFALKRSALNGFLNISGSIIAKVRLNIYSYVFFTLAVAIYSSSPWSRNFERTYIAAIDVG